MQYQDRTDNLMATFLTAEKKKIYVKTCVELDIQFVLSEHGKVSSEKDPLQLHYILNSI
jgi:hypothetical protein